MNLVLNYRKIKIKYNDGLEDPTNDHRSFPDIVVRCLFVIELCRHSSGVDV